ncbi:MAG: S8 family serine peptidase [Parcubacteria group bacterium]|nr:S8 family serine peptidase [Parcubacteria group bacterium]
MQKKQIFLFARSVSVMLILSFLSLPALAFEVSTDETKPIHEYIFRLKGDKQYLKLSIEGDQKQVLENLKNEESIDGIEMNGTYQIAFTPNDPALSEQWYLKTVRAQEAWDISQGSRDVVVAVIDSGVYIDHPDLKNNIWKNIREIADDGMDNDNNGFVDDVYGYDFVDEKGTPTPQVKKESYFSEIGVSHGTAVAGIIAAQAHNQKGIAGLAFRTRIMGIRALDAQGYGDTATVLKAFEYAIDNGADVINMSFFGFSESEFFNELLRKAHEKGIVVVAAAGNIPGGRNLNTQPGYPVCSLSKQEVNYIIGVAAVDEDGYRAEFSNYGDDCVDINAPGTNFYSALYFNPSVGLNNFYGDGWSGTSFSAPLVSASFALLKSLAPSLSVDEMQDMVLKNSYDNLTQNVSYPNGLGSGRLDVRKALGAVPAVKRVAQNLKFDAFPFPFLTAPIQQPTNQSPTSQKEAMLALVPYGKSASKVVLYDTRLGEATSSFEAYPFLFEGGLHVATGDVNAKVGDEIIVGPGNGGGPHIRVFSQDGKVISQFFAYEKDYRGGVSVAVGDIDGDGVGEIITAPGKAHDPLIRVFDVKGDLKLEFLAYEKSYRFGVNVSAGSEEGELRIVASLMSGSPKISVFDGKGNAMSSFLAYSDGKKGSVQTQMVRFEKKELSGKLVTVDAIAIMSEDAARHVKVMTLNGKKLLEFSADHNEKPLSLIFSPLGEISLGSFGIMDMNGFIYAYDRFGVYENTYEAISDFINVGARMSFIHS